MSDWDPHELDSFTRPGHDRDVALAILSQARHRNPPLNDIQVRHLLVIGYSAGREAALADMERRHRARYQHDGRNT